MRAILVIILIVALAFASFALVVGVSLGTGWVLTRFLPFSLFEGTLVSMVAAVVTFATWRGILRILSDTRYRPPLGDYGGGGRGDTSVAVLGEQGGADVGELVPVLVCERGLRRADR